MSLVLLLLQIGLAAMFVVAATGKFLRSEEFATALRLSRLPEAVVPPLVVGVPALEAAVALWLVLASPGALPAAFLAAALLLAAFTLWMASVSGRRLSVSCACFGAASGTVGTATIGRNVALFVAALAGWQLSRTTASPLPGPTLPMAVAATSLAMALALAVAARTALPFMKLTLAAFDREYTDVEQ